MSELKKVYYPVVGGDYEKNGVKGRKMVKCYLTYQLGGMNWATSRPERRGYYIHVAPVSVEDRGGYKMESYTAFTGAKCLVLECARQGKKKLEEAMRLFDEKRREIAEQVIAGSADIGSVDFEHATA